jgi:L-ascorbate metabolism protein UlaG (beta-lactamase superfamily)
MPKLLKILTIFLSILICFDSAFANPSATTITWYGHAAFKIQTPKGRVLWIDPWLSNPLNPSSQKGQDALSAVDKADYLLVTHGHFDHVGDSVQIAKKTKAKLIATFDLADAMVKVLKFPAEQIGFDTLGNPGGEITIADGEVKVAFTQAIHSSNLASVDNDKKDTPAVYGGVAVGFVIKIQNGPTIYHSGDTAYFSDMKLIGKKYNPDVALINIGGHFGMEIDEAIQAAKDINAKLSIPHHYQTFPVLNQSADKFLLGLKKSKLKGKELKPGEVIEFK